MAVIDFNAHVGCDMALMSLVGSSSLYVKNIRHKGCVMDMAYKHSACRRAGQVLRVLHASPLQISFIRKIIRIRGT